MLLYPTWKINRVVIHLTRYKSNIDSSSISPELLDSLKDGIFCGVYKSTYY